MSRHLYSLGKFNGYGFGFPTISNSNMLDVVVSGTPCQYNLEGPPYIHISEKDFAEFFYRAKTLTGSSDILYTIAIEDVAHGSYAGFNNNSGSSVSLPLDSSFTHTTPKELEPPTTTTGIYERDILGSFSKVSWGYESGDRNSLVDGSFVHGNFSLELQIDLGTFDGPLGSKGKAYDPVFVEATYAGVHYDLELPVFVWYPGVGAYIIPNGKSGNSLMHVTADGTWGSGATNLFLEAVHVPRFPGLVGSISDPVKAIFASGGDVASIYSYPDYTEHDFSVNFAGGGMRDKYYLKTFLANNDTSIAFGTLEFFISHMDLAISEWHDFAGSVNPSTGVWSGY